MVSRVKQLVVIAWNLRFQPRIAPGTRRLVFKTWARNAFIAPQASVQFARIFIRQRAARPR
jgi:hypothetical protein